MASLGVLSKRYKEGTIRLLEKSLGIKFPTREELERSRRAVYMDELERIDQERKAKEQERAEEEAKHLEEMGWYKGEDGKYYPKEETGVLEVKEEPETCGCKAEEIKQAAEAGGYQKMVHVCGCGVKDE